MGGVALEVCFTRRSSRPLSAVCSQGPRGVVTPISVRTVAIPVPGVGFAATDVALRRPDDDTIASKLESIWGDCMQGNTWRSRPIRRHVDR